MKQKCVKIIYTFLVVDKLNTRNEFTENEILMSCDISPSLKQKNRNSISKFRAFRKTEIFAKRSNQLSLMLIT